jgi:hypothetical protein
MHEVVRDTGDVADDAVVARAEKLTRAQRRARRATVPAEGVYGIDSKDAGADSWIGRYVFWAESVDEAKRRTREAGFHQRQITAQWSPGQTPPEVLPSELHRGDGHWYRSRLDDGGWTPWEQLPADYRHPPQGLAAKDPSLR